MPRHPSPRVCRNLADLFRAIPGQDADGAASYSQVPNQTAIPCSFQPITTDEVVDEQGRVISYVKYDVIWPFGPTLNARDKLVWNDTDSGIVHTAFVEGTQNEAGRGMAWLTTAVERR